MYFAILFYQRIDRSSYDQYAEFVRYEIMKTEVMIFNVNEKVITKYAIRLEFKMVEVCGDFKFIQFESWKHLQLQSILCAARNRKKIGFMYYAGKSLSQNMMWFGF